ncbi:hypothetical protein ACRRTK_018062 [Alexandromys fortis]
MSAGLHSLIFGLHSRNLGQPRLPTAGFLGPLGGGNSVPRAPPAPHPIRSGPQPPPRPLLSPQPPREPRELEGTLGKFPSPPPRQRKHRRGVARFLEPRPLLLAYGLALEAVCPLDPPVPSFDWFTGPSVVSGGGCNLAEKGRSSRRKSAGVSARCLSRRRGLLVGGRLDVQRHRPGGVGGEVLGRATIVSEIVDLAWGASRANFTLWGPAQGSRPRGWGPSRGWV